MTDATLPHYTIQLYAMGMTDSFEQWPVDPGWTHYPRIFRDYFTQNKNPFMNQPGLHWMSARVLLPLLNWKTH